MVGIVCSCKRFGAVEPIAGGFSDGLWRKKKGPLARALLIHKLLLWLWQSLVAMTMTMVSAVTVVSAVAVVATVAVVTTVAVVATVAVVTITVMAVFALVAVAFVILAAAVAVVAFAVLVEAGAASVVAPEAKAEAVALNPRNAGDRAAGAEAEKCDCEDRRQT